ncbi:MAG: C-GCAxxG-C-C family protein [Candidatus Methanomethylophilaceae archaeon]
MYEDSAHTDTPEGCGIPYIGDGHRYTLPSDSGCMDRDLLIRLTDEGYDCAQIVVKAFEKELGDSYGAAMRSVSCMSMGLLQGSLCGAVIGALTVIGFRYGSDGPDPSSKGMCMIKREMFFAEYRKLTSGTTCPEILGLDVRKNEDNIRALKENLFMKRCPDLFLGIIGIVEGLI